MTTKYEDMIGEVTDEENEATAPEPEPGEPEPEPAPEPEPEPEQAQALAGVDEKALEREIRRHGREMEKVLGGAFPDMTACPQCEGMGYVPEAIVAAPELADDPTTQRCEACHGLGLVKTGSLRDGQDVRSCLTCNGNGYITRPQEPAQAGNGASAGGYTFTPSPSPPMGHEAQAAVDFLRSQGFVVSPPLVGSP